MLKSVEYIRPTLQEFIANAVSVNYFSAGPDYNAILDQVLTENMFFVNNANPANTMDSYQVLERFIKVLISKQGGQEKGKYLDADRLPRELDLISDPNVNIGEFVANIGGLDAFAKLVARRVLVGYVPIPLTPKHREEVENDKASTRPREMNLRTGNMQKLIQDLFGVKIVFVANTTSDDKGFGKEVMMNPAAEPKSKSRTGNRLCHLFTCREKSVRSYGFQIFISKFARQSPKSHRQLRHSGEARARRLSRFRRSATGSGNRLATAMAPSLDGIQLDLEQAGSDRTRAGAPGKGERI